MPVVQSMDGKFYDIPDDQASQFEVPRERVKELLEKMGAPAPQGGPQGGGQGAPGPMQGPMQPPMQDRAPGGAPGAGPSVLVQIYGSQQAPAYGYAPPDAQGMQGQPPPGQQMQAQGDPAQGDPAQGGDGEVNPYWWWRNITFYRPWGNYWPNYWRNW